jgi:hypothetical protein
MSTVDIQDYDDGAMQCRRMFCRHTVWDDLRGVCHLFLSDHTLGKSRLRFFSPVFWLEGSMCRRCMQG